MSYMDRLSGAAVASSGCNGRPVMRTGEQSNAHTPEELVAWAMLKLAIEDTAILARYGLIDRRGECKPWPMVWRREGAKQYQDHMTIACMYGPLDHVALKEFWLDPTQAQLWCDLVGFRMPAAEVWANILKENAK
jgi:hypothetical protein